jgi:hypothetical protein
MLPSYYAILIYALACNLFLLPQPIPNRENIVSAKLLLRPQLVIQREQVYLVCGNPGVTSLVTMANRV